MLQIHYTFLSKKVVLLPIYATLYKGGMTLKKFCWKLYTYDCTILLSDLNAIAISLYDNILILAILKQLFSMKIIV